MDKWKNLIEMFNHPIVRRKYPLINVFKHEIDKLTEVEQLKEMTELKKFIIENQPFPPKVFKKPYFKSQSKIMLYFPNIISFHPDKDSLTKGLEELVQELFPDGVPTDVKNQYMVNLLSELDTVFKENDSLKDIQSVHDLLKNDKIKQLTLKLRTDITEGSLNFADLIDDLLIMLEPLLEGDTMDKELLRLAYSILLKLKNKEDLNAASFAAIIYKFKNLLTIQ